MFESLGDRLQSAVHKIKGYGKITEDNIATQGMIKINSFFSEK